MKTLLVLSGGGCPGLDIHAGVGMALEGNGIFPEEIHGTSAGALYGALLANCDYSGLDAMDIIRSLSDKDVRDERPFWRARFRHINSVMAGKKLARLIEKHLPTDFDDLPGKLHAYAVMAGTGTLVDFSTGDLRFAVRASASIRGLFPLAVSEGQGFSDGGTKANVPLPANWRDFDRVIISIATQPVHYEGRGLLFNALLSVHELMEDQVEDTIRPVQHDPRVIIIRPPVDGKTGTLRFKHSLIETAYAYADEILHERT